MAQLSVYLSTAVDGSGALALVYCVMPMCPLKGKGTQKTKAKSKKIMKQDRKLILIKIVELLGSLCFSLIYQRAHAEPFLGN